MVTCVSGFNSSNITAVAADVAAFPGYTMVILAILMITLVVVVVVGNALVILAFVVDKSLRNQCNYFFLNLAISDFLVGMYEDFLCTENAFSVVGIKTYLNESLAFDAFFWGGGVSLVFIVNYRTV